MKYSVIKSNTLDIKRYISFRIIEEDSFCYKTRDV